MRNIDRAHAIDAVDVLNDFIGDFITGVMVLREYSVYFNADKIPLEMMVGIQKMCLSNLVLAFAKFKEFWKHYHDIVPMEHRDACKAILKSIRERKITEFLNRCVGHIWDNDKQRPLANSEIMDALKFMVRSNFDQFLEWINNPKANTYPLTVVSVIETVRDTIVEIHSRP